MQDLYTSLDSFASIDPEHLNYEEEYHDIVIDPDGKTSSYGTSYNFFKYGAPAIYPGTIIYAPRQVGQLSGVLYASTVAPVLSSLAISLASLNSISD